MPPEESQQLKQRIELLEQMLGAVLVSDKMLFKRHIELLNGRDIRLGTITGTKIGTATGQKLGFYGQSPISQPSANADTSGATLGQLETEVNQVKQTLRDLGLMA